MAVDLSSMVTCLLWMLQYFTVLKFKFWIGGGDGDMPVLQPHHPLPSLPGGVPLALSALNPKLSPSSSFPSVISPPCLFSAAIDLEAAREHSCRCFYCWLGFWHTGGFVGSRIHATSCHSVTVSLLMTPSVAISGGGGIVGGCATSLFWGHNNQFCQAANQLVTGGQGFEAERSLCCGREKQRGKERWTTCLLWVSDGSLLHTHMRRWAWWASK